MIQSVNLPATASLSFAISLEQVRATTARSKTQSKCISLKSLCPTRPVSKLIQGDALSVMRSMPDRSFGLIVTSPPYNMGMSTGWGLKAKSGSNWPNAALRNGYPDHSDDMPRDSYVAWQRECLTEMLRLLTDDGAIFLNMKERVQAGLRETPEDIVTGFPVRQRIAWKRAGSNNHNRGQFMPNSEIIYFIAKRACALTKAGRDLGMVWDFPQERGNPHPAPFPVELPRRCLLSVEAETVLDPFAGSGTTGVAALEAGRSFVGIEHAEEYIEQSADRLRRAYWEADWEGIAEQFPGAHPAAKNTPRPRAHRPDGNHDGTDRGNQEHLTERERDDRLVASLRSVIRDELRRDRDLKSFAAASGMLTLTELCEFLGKGRNTVYECRRQRDRAKTEAAKSRAFPPEYGDGRSPRWKRSEVEAWVTSLKRGA